MVGCGAVAAYGHLPALARLGWRPSVLVDVRRERAEQLAHRWRVPNVAQDVAAVIGDIDAAVVAVPPRLHARVALPLLKAGVHALVEKPLATSAADAAALVAAGQETNACLAVGHQRRFLFVNRWLAAAIHSGAFGRIERVIAGDGSNYNARRPRGAPEAGWNLASYWHADGPASGCGVLLDKGPHLLDLLLWWLGPVAELDYADDNEGGMEADAVLRLRFERGTRATLAFSRVRDLSNTVRIVGSRGSVEASLHGNSIRNISASLRHRRYDVRRGAACHAESMWARGGPGERQLADWLAAVRDGRPPFVSGESALPVAALIERCTASRRPQTGRWRVPRAEREPAAVAAAIAGLRGRTVLVTGAGGCIGGWLTQRLVRGGVRVRAGLRRFGSAARLARLPPSMVELRQFEMAGTDGAAACELVAGCAAVFHLAVDLNSPAANVAGVRQLGAACAKNAVRLVFTSSYTVYRPFPDGPLRETQNQPLATSANARCEREIAAMARDDGLDAIVLQPTIVYGPFATHWTDAPAAALRRGPAVLPLEDGVCNAVYVQDVVSALVAAARPEAGGGTMLISGPDHPTWAEFYAQLATVVGSGHGVARRSAAGIARSRKRGASARLRAVAAWLRAKAVRRPRLRRLMARGKRVVDSGVNAARRLRRQLAWRPGGSVAPLIRPASAPAAPGLPSARHVEEFAAKPRVDTGEARRVLGYAPTYSLAEGMALTAEYLRWTDEDATSPRMAGVPRQATPTGE